MGQPSVARMVEEYATLRDPAADPLLEAVKAALALEEATGIVVPRGLLDAAHLGTDQAMLSTAERLAART